MNEVMFSDPGVEDSDEAGRVGVLHVLESGPVVGVYRLPLVSPHGQGGSLLMDEVAAAAVAAKALLREGVAALCFVGSIVFQIDPQLLRPVRELALAAVGTVSLLHEVFAEGALGLGAAAAIGEMVRGAAEDLPLELNVLALGGGL